MKKLSIIMAVTVLFGITLTTSLFASDKGHAGKHTGHAGKMIHANTVEGYRFAYHLIDIRKHMKNRKGSNVTHHLMVYITDPDGHSLKKTKVGYLLTDPDGGKQKKMTMAMGGGFGADVNLGTKGAYTVKTKVLAGGKKLLDQFTYEAD